MKRAEVRKILKEENLRYYNMFLERPVGPWEVVVYQQEDTWVVCAADERAAIAEHSYRYFSNEEEALDCFLRLVRLEKILPPNG